MRISDWSSDVCSSDLFETAMLLNPNLFESYFFYGRACMSAGNVEKAARLFQHAAEVNPSDYRSLGFLSQAYEAMGRTDSAHESMDRADRKSTRLNSSH